MNEQSIRAELTSRGYSPEQVDDLAPRIFSGDLFLWDWDNDVHEFPPPGHVGAEFPTSYDDDGMPFERDYPVDGW